MRLLVIEDETRISEILKKGLTRAGFTVDTVDRLADAREAIALTAYDAAYVAVAGRYGWQLVSTDIRDLVSKGLAVTPDAAVYP